MLPRKSKTQLIRIRETALNGEEKTIMKRNFLKRNFLKWISLAGILAASAALSACGSSQQAAGSAAAGSSAASEAASSADSGSSEAASSAAGASGAASESKSADANGGTLTVGFDQEFPPMGFVGDDGQYTGFDLELAQEAAKRLGLTYKAQPIAWDSKDMELDSGSIDCIWNGFTITGREDDYTWSEPYMDNSIVFVVRNDSGIKSQADLAGKIVEVQMDSSGEKALDDAADLKASFKQVLTTPDYNTAFMDLEQGSVDAICMDIVVASYQITQRKAPMTILDDALSSEQYAVGFKKGNTELRDKVNKALDEMAADGTMAKTSEKWFGRDITTIKK